MNITDSIYMQQAWWVQRRDQVPYFQPHFKPTFDQDQWSAARRPLLQKLRYYEPKADYNALDPFRWNSE